MVFFCLNFLYYILYTTDTTNMDVFRVIYAILLLCFLAITVAGVVFSVKETTDYDNKTNDEKIKATFTIIFTGISGILVLFFLYKMISG